MKNYTKIGAFALALILSVATLTACGGGSEDSGDADKVIKVAATVTPHAEVLEGVVADELAKEGWTLEVVQFPEYTQINPATTEGDVDANYFQHINYLNDYNKDNGTNLVAVADVHYEPLGVYKAKKNSFDELEKGDVIGVPNDTTNEIRALKLLEANGIIKLKEGVGSEATTKDITEYLKDVEIKELDAASIPAARPDLALAVINFNFAHDAGLKEEDAVVYEDSSGDLEGYTNVIVVNEENKDSEKTKALVAAVQSDATRKFIEETYQGLVKVKF